MVETVMQVQKGALDAQSETDSAAAMATTLASAAGNADEGTGQSERRQSQEDSAGETQVQRHLPAAILSVIAFYLPNVGKLRLAQGSLFFSQAIQQHFKLLLTRESRHVEMKFAWACNEHLMPEEGSPTTLKAQAGALPNAAGPHLKHGNVIECNWRVQYGLKHSQQCFAVSNSTLKLDPFDQGSIPTQMTSYTPVLRGINASDIKTIFMTKPRMVCVLTNDGLLKIYNTNDIQTVLNAAESFKVVDSEAAINLENQGPFILPNQVVTFPGRVH